MSILHVRQIKAALNKIFTGIDSKLNPDHISDEVALQSRKLAAYSLMDTANISAEQAAESVVDGSDDNGIDALYFDRAEPTLYIVQSKWIESGEGTMDLASINKFLNGFRDLMQGRLDRFNPKIQAREKEILEALDNAQLKISLVFVYTGKESLSEHADRALGDLLKESNDTSEMVSPIILNQLKLHKSVAGQAEGQAIDLEIALHDWGQYKEPFVAYHGQIEASDIASWWQGHGTRLFAQNLRKFIGNSSVNEEITNTLKINPEKFWYFNNGITVVCKSIQKKPLGGNDRATGFFECKGISVVNGAQTVGCIGSLSLSGTDQIGKARVSARFISLENCPEEFLTEITRATNTQNKIERRDFVSLDPEQLRLKSDLWTLGKQYSCKTGDPTTPSDNLCTLDEATVALACSWSDIALSVQAKREIGKLWENIEKTPYRTIFHDGLSGQHLWRSVEIMRIVEKKLKECQGKLTGRERSIAVHGNRFILYRVFEVLGRPSLDANGFDFEDFKIKAENATATQLELTTQAINSLFPDSAPPWVFKNLSKCKQLDVSLANS